MPVKSNHLIQLFTNRPTRQRATPFQSPSLTDDLNNRLRPIHRETAGATNRCAAVSRSRYHTPVAISFRSYRAEYRTRAPHRQTMLSVRSSGDQRITREPFSCHIGNRPWHSKALPPCAAHDAHSLGTHNSHLVQQPWDHPGDPHRPLCQHFRFFHVPCSHLLLHPI